MGRVSGRVTYKDQPVPKATVTFAPQAKGTKSAIGITDESGYFQLSTVNRATALWSVSTWFLLSPWPHSMALFLLEPGRPCWKNWNLKASRSFRKNLHTVTLGPDGRCGIRLQHDRLSADGRTVIGSHYRSAETCPS